MAVTVSVLIAPAVFHHYLAVLVLPLLLALAADVSPIIVVAAYFLMWGGQQPALGDWAWVLSRVPQTLGWALLLVGLARVRRRVDVTVSDSRAHDVQFVQQIGRASCRERV